MGGRLHILPPTLITSQTLRPGLEVPVYHAWRAERSREGHRFLQSEVFQQNAVHAPKKSQPQSTIGADGAPSSRKL